MSIPTDIQHLMLEAWESILPKLKNDPDELHRRLARRRTAVLTNPWRPYCLAIKANDHRISPYRAIFTPEHAIRLDDPRHPYEYLEHTVTIDSNLVRHLTRPYQILPPGEPAFEIARKLGWSYTQLSHLMRRGLFHINPKPGLRGRRGRPIPVLYVDRLLDPTSDSNLEMPDPLWGTHDTFLADRVPDGIEQTITRRPVPSRFNRHRFGGWHWVCPACQELAPVIYRPLPPPMLDLQSDLPRLLDVDERERGLQCFACHRCHRIQRATRVGPFLWNILITLFSGGLLYGHEVDRPPNYAKGIRRKMAFQNRRSFRSEPRHADILRLLTETDWPMNRIAVELSISRPTLFRHARRAYREHAVPNRAELRAALARRKAAERIAIPNVA